jgi:hypothetical protein
MSSSAVVASVEWNVWVGRFEKLLIVPCCAAMLKRMLVLDSITQELFSTYFQNVGLNRMLTTDTVRAPLAT